MKMVIINVKMFPGKTFVLDFNKQFSKVNLKRAVQPLWRTSKLDRFYGIYLVLTKKIAQRTKQLTHVRVARATKISIKN